MPEQHCPSLLQELFGAEDDGHRRADLADRVAHDLTDRLGGDGHEGEVEPLRSGGAGVLTSVTKADGFVIVPRDDEGFEAGTEVEVYLF